MIKKINAVHGMHDYIFPDTLLWQYVEDTIKSILNSYGYKEIKLPILEKSELFKKNIGENTDIIEKEMYNLCDRNGDNLTLRPEGTTGFIRAIVEHNLFYNKNKRFWYNGPMFRYERPQKGRYRQFNQIGIEVLGFESPYIDIEIIIITYNLWKKLNIIKNIFLEINSIGSLTDRKKYIKELIFFLKKNINSLDENCKKKIYTNPLRILDSKNKIVQQLLNKAPKLQNYLNDNSIKKFKELCKILSFMNINFVVNNNLVRGLDYYNDIVFEWKTNKIGSHKTICGGGRYDLLIKVMSNNKDINGIGCAIGLERLLLLIQNKQSIKIETEYFIDIYIAPLLKNKYIIQKIFFIGELIRKNFPLLRIVTSYVFKNLNKQIIQAVKQKARFILIIGQYEIMNNLIIIKDLHLKKQMIFSEQELIFKLKKIFKKY
ncbi:histidine--tRNA ligase [Enterobacteriaceae endosymbiont of Donacia tomentosa]|uniref:histidine--tRNA ligase n=1 Tax=Enterobacteriaceae endosymbiont of Donacia tomentosa TaxID=2675787 RepID=UPI0014492EBC|nr:histidine--tRNA ligase [Enterobacteriaceae endosymbiont of Donacia tomentosa]QJC31499.1 histidine--tRNA ligase [Enterobacteriaceae endosymbiont of Donacia tomentosa]